MEVAVFQMSLYFQNTSAIVLMLLVDFNCIFLILWGFNNFFFLILWGFIVCRGDAYGDLPYTPLCGSNMNIVGFTICLSNPYTRSVQPLWAWGSLIFIPWWERSEYCSFMCAIWLNPRPSWCAREGAEAGWQLAVTCCRRQNSVAAWIFSCGNQTASISSRL